MTSEVAREHAAASDTAAAVAAAEATDAPTALTEMRARARIAGSPLVAAGVQWADDGRVAVVSEASIMISTFLSRELEMYIQQSPAISKSFIFVPQHTAHERVPLAIPVFNEPSDATLPSGSLSYFLLNEKDRHQYNPKELSLSKNDGTAFLAAVWGPRGSGPNSSCALLALTSSSRISLHFSSSFHLSWNEVGVFSENLFEFLESRQWTLTSSSSSSNSSCSSASATPSKHAHSNGDNAATATPATKKGGTHSSVTPASGSTKKRKRAQHIANGSADSATVSMSEYARRCGLASTLSVAWSPFVTNKEQHTTSLIALCGRTIVTVWGYDYPSFEAFAAVENRAVQSSTSPTATSSAFLSSTPFAWISTARYGWVTTSAWQQTHRSPTQSNAELRLALGTSEGNVLLACIPIMPRDVHVAEVAIERVIVTPHAQPVYGLRLGSRSTYSNSKRNDLVVASGSRISVWNINKKRSPLVSWKAHSGNVTGLDIDYFGDKIFTCGVDGRIRLWDKVTGEESPFQSTDDDTVGSDDHAPNFGRPQQGQLPKYPVFGLAVSPNSAQVACIYVIPPAARPNRKSQADVSYSRVSTALEYLPSPFATRTGTFVTTMCRILEESQDTSTLADVLWFCHEDNAAITTLQTSSELALPFMLNSLRGMTRTSPRSDFSRQPLYLSLCEELEHRYDKACRDSAMDVLSKVALPLLLQVSYLLRNCITPAEHHTAIRDEALIKLKRALYVYWAERCLKELLASHSQVQNFADISKTERISALLMADFLSVQQPMSSSIERLVTTIYNRLGSEENIARWSTYLQERVDHQGRMRKSAERRATAEDGTVVIAPVAPPPPPRQTCFICDEAVPFGELEQFCASGHVQDRCVLSFQVISSMDTWKCMGCGAAACEIDFSHGRSPFYLLESQSKRSNQTTGSGMMQIVCRLCGNYCSFLRY